MYRHLKKRFGLMAILLILMMTLISACGGSPNMGDGSLEGNITEGDGPSVHFIDVGQGDASLIQLEDGRNILIDGGSRSSSDKVLNYLREAGVKRLDYVMATHPHEDHIGGLPDVIEEFEIGEVYMPDKAASTKIFETLLNAIEAKGLKINMANGYENLISEDGIKFEILGPNSNSYESTNDYSIVNKLTYGDTGFLFTGDMEVESEKEILDLAYNIESTVLKVSHHGSSSSSSDEFLDAINPQFGIISASIDNSYGHPHKEIVSKLNSRNIEMLGTYDYGDIVATTDGNSVEISSKKSDKNLYSEDSPQNTEVKEENTSDDKEVIGNQNSKVYHFSDCGSLPDEDNKVYFKSEQEAIESGYRPHSTCVD